jgi:hypothetical protein
MVRLPRFAISSALALLIVLPVAAYADDAPDSSASASADSPGAISGDATVSVTSDQQALIDQVDNFWHYGKIARYDLAADAGQKILSGSATPVSILEAFESVTQKRSDNIDQWMLRWRTLPEGSDRTQNADIEKMRQVADQLNDKINAGYATRSANPDFIMNTIVAMSKGSRAYDNNLPRLAKSGELAAKVLIDILRNPDDRELNATARRALRDLGRSSLNPLMAATEMKDYDTLVDVISALGDLGYDPAIPYLSRIMTSQDEPDAIRVAARNALRHLGAADTATRDPAEEFFELGEKFYYGHSSIPPANDQTAYIWYWNDSMGLTKLDVPTPIFDDVMAMRSCEYALKLDAAKAEAVSLWLAANSKREADLPAGAVDPTHKGLPDAKYYNSSAGVQYLNAALFRALRDRNAAVAFKLTESLQGIIGQNNMTGSESEPIIQALYFPNRQVRYQAAFALAEALPTRSFAGSDRVVPTLVAALSQTDHLSVLIVAPSADGQLNSLQAAVQSLGCRTVASSDPTQGANAAASLPNVDLIVISEDSDVNGMIDLAQTNVQLQGASILVLTRSAASPFVAKSAGNPQLSAALMPAHDGLASALKTDIDQTMLRSGIPPMDEKEASAYALKAAQLLENLAICRGGVLDVSQAEAGVLTALADSRPPIVISAGRVLAMIDSPTAQNGLASKALDPATVSEERVALFKSLAANAKFYGNRLDSLKISQLEKVVAEEKDGAVRDAAAEARGALNLPADQARTLILSQSKM